MKFSYFPGCTDHSSSLEYGLSTHEVFKTLGVELVEIEDWNCCGAAATHSLNRLLSLCLPARNISKAQSAQVTARVVDAIRADKPYNEAKRGAEASLVTSMGRMAAHTGQEITFDDILNCEHEFAPDVDKLTMSSSPPLKSNADGKYPVPMPGITKKTEY